ncbi:lipoprotein [Corallococcus macrosporus]|uniref:Putative lipoprotein n=1 Tax=Myxococcus fulvus (strain ATCC BAA-855 / HW-1) TaxID=483219 RepID=F8CBA5_MYXFH|nr:lipoprotein [Corallococcus macrosporus]AEI62210.1 putative lipoprotein [Corallococcus macrosporus]
MKKLLIGLVASSALVFGTGCGDSTEPEDVCERFFSAMIDIDQKACGEVSEGPTDQERNEAIQQCSTQIERCTEDDREKMNRIADCINDIDDCREGREDEFAGAFLACLIQEGSFSESCNISADIED